MATSTCHHHRMKVHMNVTTPPRPTYPICAVASSTEHHQESVFINVASPLWLLIFHPSPNPTLPNPPRPICSVASSTQHHHGKILQNHHPKTVNVARSPCASMHEQWYPIPPHPNKSAAQHPQGSIINVALSPCADVHKHKHGHKNPGTWETD